MSYSYSYSTTDTSALMAFFATYSIILLIVCIFAIVCMWKIFTKAGRPGWASLIPIYNMYVYFDIAWGNGLFFLLTFVPFVNFVVAIIQNVKLAQVFGKGGGFAVGLIFLPIIFLPILAFGSSTYRG